MKKKQLPFSAGLDLSQTVSLTLLYGANSWNDYKKFKLFRDLSGKWEKWFLLETVVLPPLEDPAHFDWSALTEAPYINAFSSEPTTLEYRKKIALSALLAGIETIRFFPPQLTDNVSEFFRNDSKETGGQCERYTN